MPTCATKSVKILRLSVSGGPLVMTTIMIEEGVASPDSEGVKLARLARWRAFGSFGGTKELALVLSRQKVQDIRYFENELNNINILNSCYRGND